MLKSRLLKDSWVIPDLTALDELTSNQQRFIIRFLQEADIERGAKAAKIDLSTASRWLENETVHMAVEGARQEALRLGLDKLYDWIKFQKGQERERFWRNLRGYEFEYEFARVLRELGYQVEPTKATRDKGIDLELSDGSQSAVVQCKAQKKSVGSPVVQAVYGAMHKRKADYAIVVSVGGFTPDAKDFAKDQPEIELLNLDDIVALDLESQGW